MDVLPEARAIALLVDLRRYLRALAASDDREAALHLHSRLLAGLPAGTAARASLHILGDVTPEDCRTVADELSARVLEWVTSSHPDAPDAVQVTLRWPDRRRIHIVGYFEADRWRFLPWPRDTVGPRARLGVRLGLVKAKSDVLDKVDLPDED